MVRILGIKLLVPLFGFQDFIYVLHGNVIGHVSPRGKSVPGKAAGGEADYGVFSRVDYPQEESQRQFQIASKPSPYLRAKSRT